MPGLEGYKVALVASRKREMQDELRRSCNAIMRLELPWLVQRGSHGRDLPAEIARWLKSVSIFRRGDSPPMIHFRRLCGFEILVLLETRGVPRGDFAVAFEQEVDACSC